MSRPTCRVGRRADDVTLVGAAKQVDVARLEAALAAGLRHIGENYVQEALPKVAAIGDRAVWHFIGHLQRNKARDVVPRFDLIETVDSVRLAQEVDRRAAQAGRRLAVLLQVNVGGEESKFGVPPEDLVALYDAVAELQSLDVQGLMAVPPFVPEAELSRPYFRRLRELRDALQRARPEAHVPHLSMGMSLDFEVAIEEGATMVRVGTDLFGPRPAP
jgi:hypothetical protein